LSGDVTKCGNGSSSHCGLCFHPPAR
jgi:hypothetical protein